MANLTLRSIPDDVMERLRTLAAVERRSLNGEILVLIEASLERETTETSRTAPLISAVMQARLWDDLCGRWKDTRGWKEISDDIVTHRTAGRKVTL